MTVHKVGEDFRFPLAEGIIRQPGSDRHKAPRLRKPSSRPAGGDPRLIHEEEEDENSEEYPGENLEKGQDSSEEEEDSAEAAGGTLSKHRNLTFGVSLTIAS